jgi:hypothetical protein
MTGSSKETESIRSERELHELVVVVSMLVKEVENQGRRSQRSPRSVVAPHQALLRSSTDQAIITSIISMWKTFSHKPLSALYFPSVLSFFKYKSPLQRVFQVECSTRSAQEVYPSPVSWLDEELSVEQARSLA